jgi:hypothetical protein
VPINISGMTIFDSQSEADRLLVSSVDISFFFSVQIQRRIPTRQKRDRRENGKRKEK